VDSVLFSTNTVVNSETSPNSIYLAEVIHYSEHESLRINTSVNVTQQNKDIDFLAGKLMKRPKQVYKGRWGKFETITLRWETDRVLYVNEIKYEI
jgi:hypothetical protein